MVAERSVVGETGEDGGVVRVNGRGGVEDVGIDEDGNVRVEAAVVGEEGEELGIYEDGVDFGVREDVSEVCGLEAVVDSLA